MKRQVYGYFVLGFKARRRLAMANKQGLPATQSSRPFDGEGKGVVYYYVGIFNYDDGIIVSYAGTVSCPYQVYPLFFLSLSNPLH